MVSNPENSKTSITQPLPFAPPPLPEEVERFTNNFTRLTGREPRDYDINWHSLLWQTNVERRRKLVEQNAQSD